MQPLCKARWSFGFIYALVAMALFLSFRVLNIADMTTDGAFTLGCAVSATAAVAGRPVLGLVLAVLAGACAGFVTAFFADAHGRALHSGGHHHQHRALYSEPCHHGFFPPMCPC